MAVEHEESTVWKAISLTYVEYPNGNLFGYLLAWSSLLPIFMCISFGTLILFRRDLHTIAYFVGLLLDEFCNMILKNTIKEYRPLRGRDTLYTEYGMPSSHAQFMSFFTTYLALFLLIRVHHNNKFADNLWKYLSLLISISASGVVAYSRIYLMYHSTSQVGWGLLAGGVLGVFWFLIVQYVFTPFFPVIASWPISEYLMVRDSTLIPNVLWFEYCSHRGEARSRQRKITIRKSM